MMLDSALVARISCLALLVRERLWVNFCFACNLLAAMVLMGKMYNFTFDY